jgi:hypothetical protein
LNSWLISDAALREAHRSLTQDGGVVLTDSLQNASSPERCLNTAHLSSGVDEDDVQWRPNTCQSAAWLTQGLLVSLPGRAKPSMSSEVAEQWVLVGVFDDANRGRSAAAELDGIGLRWWQIGRAVQNGELTEATGALMAIDVPEHDLTGGLIALGVPVAPARAYASEFERSRTIVTVHGTAGLGQAAQALEQAGARSTLMWSARPIPNGSRLEGVRPPAPPPGDS